MALSHASLGIGCTLWDTGTPVTQHDLYHNSNGHIEMENLQKASKTDINETVHEITNMMSSNIDNDVTDIMSPNDYHDVISLTSLGSIKEVNTVKSQDINFDNCNRVSGEHDVTGMTSRNSISEKNMTSSGINIDIGNAQSLDINDVTGMTSQHIDSKENMTSSRINIDVENIQSLKNNNDVTGMTSQQSNDSVTKVLVNGNVSDPRMTSETTDEVTAKCNVTDSKMVLKDSMRNGACGHSQSNCRDDVINSPYVINDITT